MEEFRLHSRHCPYGQPDGVRRLDIDTDYGAFPVWTWVTLSPVNGGPPREACASVGPEYLQISAELAAELRAWASWQDQHQHAAWRGTSGKPEPSTDEDQARWRANGWMLAERLGRETGDEVVYQWPSDGRDPDCAYCGNSGAL
ncbi:hypothetical protein [Micromonospora pattaloongensis]|uniref:hypothetical protein n=1 Tax=Micromonospora pattaloongensis TaxID=405436 RepID=UPI0011151E74|nr:hypothetical protein [Micromonospora pattaloongensis]